MGIANLSVPLAKLGRAKEHLDVMECEIDRFGTTDAKTVRITLERQKSWCEVCIDPIPAVPSHVALVVGDILTNLRATLDYLAWQLVLREDHKPQKTTCFPIYESKRLFGKEVQNAPQRGRPSPLGGIPVNGGAWTLIEGAQPFKCAQPKDHPLAIIDQLVNVDKHRTLLLQQSWPDQKTLADNISWPPEFEPIKKRFFISPLSSEHPTKIARLQYLPGREARVHVKGKLRINPSVSDGESPAVPLTHLGYLHVYVTELLEKFAALPRVQR